MRQSFTGTAGGIREKIVSLKRREKYQTANFAHFRELLEEEEHITISYSGLAKGRIERLWGDFAQLSYNVKAMQSFCGCDKGNCEVPNPYMQWRLKFVGKY